jgi:hypothetical protein
VDETSRNRILRVLDGTASGRPPVWLTASGDGDALAGLADLVNLTGLIEELNEQARRSLAPQLTVTSHLTQAQSQLADLRRTLTHATEMLAFNISRPSPLLASV